jgi:lipid II:glycine glycyltransferase (peptidoglycan interpeptide bridge formation enzyme)
MNDWAAWDAFVEATPDTGFMQSSWWVEFRNYCGFDNFGLTLTDGDRFVGGAVVLKFTYTDDRCFYYIQDGPVLPRDPLLAEDVFGALLEAIDDRRAHESCTVTHLRIEPQWLSIPDFVKGFRGIPPLTDPYVECRHTRRVDLRASEEAILAQMRPKGRYNIGLARRHGVTVVEDPTAQGLADFVRLYEATFARHGMEPKEPDYFHALLSALRSNRHGSLFFAEYAGMRLATALVVYFGDRATYFFGGSLDVHRHVKAPDLLQFEVMRQAKGLGYAWYDLWGIAPPDLDSDHSWRGFTAFKAKFGGDVVRLVPTLDYVYDATAYDAYGRLFNHPIVDDSHTVHAHALV